MAYLGFMELKDLAERHVVQIEPFLTTLIEENGGIPSSGRPEVRRSYARQDLKRWTKFRGVPLFLDDRPQTGDPTAASFMVIAAYLERL